MPSGTAAALLVKPVCCTQKMAFDVVVPPAIKSRINKRCLGLTSMSGNRCGSITRSGSCGVVRAACTGTERRRLAEILPLTAFISSAEITCWPNVCATCTAFCRGICATCCCSSPSSALRDFSASRRVFSSAAILSTDALVSVDRPPTFFASFRASSAFALN
ncbi:hypothetical protein Xekk_01611 [Xenorhabdus sp. KK7.4]|nr:hypothetical protein Xekk_01611 [Xenorhabdus sp. KK7.4]